MARAVRLPVTCLAAAMLVAASAYVQTSSSPASSARPSVAAAAPRESSTAPQTRPPDFIENRGQWPASVRFAARAGEVWTALESHAVRLLPGGGRPVILRFEGAAPGATLHGEGRRPTVYNFISGRDQSAWRTNVPSFRSAIYRGMYPGVDVRVREVTSHFEYDLLVAPGADLAQVLIRVDGATGLELSGDGSLLLATPEGKLRQTPPVTFEVQPDGTMRRITSRFRVLAADRYGFEAPGRDHSRPLVVDPGLIWSTLTGGASRESFSAIEAARDGSGDLFLAGSSNSPDFSGASNGAVHTARFQMYVARIAAAGDEYRFVTFVNGLQNQTYPGGIAADRTGGVTVVGTTVDLDFPATAGAFQRQIAPHQTGLSEGDAFVLRLNATGGILFGTYLGGRGSDGASAVAVIDSPAGNEPAGFIVTGTVRSENFPVTAGAYDETLNTALAGDPTTFSSDTFITRFTADLSAVTYSTFFGGQTYEHPQEVAVDAAGFVTIAGTTSSSQSGRDMPVTADAFDSTWNGSEDGFIARFKLDGNGTADLKYASFLGGVNRDEIDGLALDPSNPHLVTVVGYAWYDNFTGPFFPTTAGVVKPSLTPVGISPLFPHTKTGFATRFNFGPGAPANKLVWSTFAGGNWEDYLSDVAIAEDGSVIVVGGTRSYDLTTMRGAYDRTQDGVGLGPDDCFVWKLSPDARQLLYSTYFGGTYGDCVPVLSIGARVAYLGNNRIALAGETESGDFTTTENAIVAGTNEAADGVNPFVATLELAHDASGDVTAAAPSLLTPASNSQTSGFGGLVRFRWTEVSDPSGIEGYVYEISSRPDFAPEWTMPKGSTNAPELLVSSLASQTQYYWRVRTADRAGNLSDWSSTGTFKLGVDGAPPIINYVQTYPAPIVGGTSAQGVLHLSGPAPTDMHVLLTAADGRGFLRTELPLTIPPTVTIPAGAVTANFPIATSPVAASFPTVIYATVDGIGAKGTVAIDPPGGPTVQSIIADPYVVRGGNPSRGTVTLTGPAPAGGLRVPVRVSHPAYATVPAEVVVPAGQKSASFTIPTVPVPFSFDATIEAGARYAKLALKKDALPTLQSITLSRTTAAGGDAVTGTVTFSGPVVPSPFPGTTDAIVLLKSTNPAIGMSWLVSVPAGQSSATFPIGVRNVPATTTAEVIATYDNVELRAPLTITGRPATIASLTVNVSTVMAGQGGVGYVNLSAPAPAGHVLVSLSTNSPAVNIPPDVTVSSGGTQGLFSFTSNSVDATTAATITASYGASSASTGVTVNPSFPRSVWVTGVSLSPSTVSGGSSSTGTVTLNAPAPTGGVSVQLSSPAPAVVPPTVTIPAGSTSGVFSVSTSNVSATAQARIYAVLNTSWSAILTVTPGAATGPTVSALSLSPASVTGGNSSTGTVTLSGAAPSGGTVVSLSSGSSLATVPASITVPAGASSRTFTVTTQSVGSSTSAAITATRGVSRTATLTITAPSTVPSAPALQFPASGATSVGQPITFDWSDVANAASYELQVDNSSTLSSPYVVNVTGLTTSQYTHTGTLENRTHSWRVRARNSAGTAGAWSSARTFTPQGAPAAASLASLSLNPAMVTGTAGSQGTVTLSAPAPSGGALVTLSSGNTARATVPSSVTVAAGATSASFAIATTPGTSSSTATISGTYAGVTRSATLTVNPAGSQGTATVTVTTSGVSVTSTPAGISVASNSSGTGTFAVGTSIRLTANSRSDFSGACSRRDATSCTFTLGGNASVTVRRR